MKNSRLRAIKISLLAIAVVFGISDSAFAAETVALQFDGREWQSAGVERYNNGISAQEYLLKGETIDNWSEHVRVEYNPGAQRVLSPATFEKTLKEGLEKNCSDVEWESLPQGDFERIWVWSRKGCGGLPDNAGVGRLVATQEALHIFQYATHTVPMPADKRSEWIQRLKATIITRN